MTVITPELQAKIEKAKAENQRRQQDNEWGGLCLATKVLIERGYKSDARTLIQDYFKNHQR